MAAPPPMLPPLILIPATPSLPTVVPAPMPAPPVVGLRRAAAAVALPTAALVVVAGFAWPFGALFGRVALFGLVVLAFGGAVVTPA